MARLLDVVRDVLAKCQPEELPLLAGFDRLSDAEIGRRLTSRAGSDDPLAFGIGETVLLFAPVIWGAVKEVLIAIAGEGGKGLAARLKRRFGRGRVAQAELPPFTPAHLAEVHAEVIAMAKKARLKPVDAEVLADRVVARLALENGTSGEE